MLGSTWASLNAITGKLSEPSKLPGFAWGIPASTCILGSMLRQLSAATVCSVCYAMKNRLAMPYVLRAYQRRLDCYNRYAGPQWVRAMVASIRKTKKLHFRFFDSGDLQSVSMLGDIAAVARRTPEVSYWVATRERGILRAYRNAGRTIPRNLCIRVSMPLIDSPIPKRRDRYPLSVVHSAKPQPGAYLCPAPTQGGECKDCRACWDRSVPAVTYLEH